LVIGVTLTVIWILIVVMKQVFLAVRSDPYIGPPTGVCIAAASSAKPAGPNIPKQLPKSFRQLIDKRLSIINGLATRKGGRGVINFLMKVIDVLHLRRTSSKVRLACHFAFYVSKLIRTQGMPGTVKQLKALQVLLMQGLARFRVLDISELGSGVSRTRAGLPRIIPCQQRVLLRNMDVPTIRLWMSFFGLFRILTYPGVLKTSTITNPGVKLEEQWLEE
jgi:hypothetical protein